MKRSLVLMLTMVFHIGCVTTINKQEVSKIDKVAIVGFDVVKITRKFDKEADQSASKEENQELAAKFYKEMRSSLVQRAGWQVLSQNEVAKNFAYKKFYDQHKKARKFRIRGGRELHAKGILVAKPFMDMKKDQVKPLLRSLGVDAIVLVEAGIDLGASTIRTDKATVAYSTLLEDFKIFNGRSDEPVVRLMNKNGDTPDLDGKMELSGDYKAGNTDYPMITSFRELSREVGEELATARAH